MDRNSPRENRLDYNQRSDRKEREDRRVEQPIHKIEKQKVQTRVANTAKLNIRKKPSKESEVSCIVNFDERLLVEYENDTWAKVLTKSKEGFAMRAFLKEV